MDNNNNTSTTETLNTDKKKIIRSASYPAITVNEAYEFVLKINDKFGANALITREEIALALGLNPASITREIAACVQFGFLTKQQNEGKYNLTPLFNDIFRHENDRDRKINFIKAFGSPKLYQELLSKLDNNIIPAEITNTLIKHHNITEGASKGAADVFIESAKQVGVLSDNRVLKFSVTLSTLSKTQYAVIEDLGNEGSNNEDSQNLENPGLPALVGKENQGRKTINIPIHLTGNKVAGLSYPDDISANDIRLIRHQIDGVLLRIELENEGRLKGTEVPS